MIIGWSQHIILRGNIRPTHIDGYSHILKHKHRHTLKHKNIKHMPPIYPHNHTYSDIGACTHHPPTYTTYTHPHTQKAPAQAHIYKNTCNHRHTSIHIGTYIYIKAHKHTLTYEGSYG